VAVVLTDKTNKNKYT